MHGAQGGQDQAALLDRELNHWLEVSKHEIFVQFGKTNEDICILITEKIIYYILYFQDENSILIGHKPI